MRRRTQVLLAAGVATGCIIPVSQAGAQTTSTPGGWPGVTVGIPVGVAAPQHTGSCTDPATGEWVIPGDAILNEGQQFVCTDGTLVPVAGYGLPPGFWVRTVTGHIGDCGPGSLPRQHPGVIVGYGPGDDTSALICPPLPYGNGTVNPS